MSVVLRTRLGVRDFKDSRDLDLSEVSSSDPWLAGGSPKIVPVPRGCKTPSLWHVFHRSEEVPGNASASFLGASMAPRADLTQTLTSQTVCLLGSS